MTIHHHPMHEPLRTQDNTFPRPKKLRYLKVAKVGKESGALRKLTTPTPANPTCENSLEALLSTEAIPLQYNHLHSLRDATEFSHPGPCNPPLNLPPPAPRNPQSCFRYAGSAPAPPPEPNLCSSPPPSPSLQHHLLPAGCLDRQSQYYDRHRPSLHFPSPADTHWHSSNDPPHKPHAPSLFRHRYRLPPATHPRSSNHPGTLADFITSNATTTKASTPKPPRHNHIHPVDQTHTRTQCPRIQHLVHRKREANIYQPPAFLLFSTPPHASPPLHLTGTLTAFEDAGPIPPSFSVACSPSGARTRGGSPDGT